MNAIRCWCAGSTDWAARSCLLPMPRAAGPPTGSPGRVSTSSGPTSFATCFRTPKRARRKWTTTARAAISSSTSGSAATSRAAEKCRAFSPSVPADSNIRCPSRNSRTKAYRGRIHIGQLQGLFRIRPLEESRAFPEVGSYRQEQELLDYGSNRFSAAFHFRIHRRPIQSDAQPGVRVRRKLGIVHAALVAGAARAGDSAQPGRVDHAEGQGNDRRHLLEEGRGYGLKSR